MKRNHQRIQRVLAVRRLQEQTLRAHWVEAEHSAMAGEESAEESRDRCSQARHQLANSRRVGPVDARGTLRDLCALDQMSSQVAQLQECARGLRREAEERRQPWESRRRTVQGLERLVESRRLKMHRADEQREQNGLDEIASARFLARNTTSPSTGRSRTPPSLSTSSPSVGTASMSTQNRPCPSPTDPSSNGKG